MNREIKFRGKRIDNGKWVYGYYWTNEAENYFIKVIKDKKNNFVSDPTENDFEINPKTVGQYTGLKDKNGKEIYEGDILYIITTLKNGSARQDIAKVVFNERYCYYALTVFNNGIYKRTSKLSSYAYKSEIIGNIYENPELLEGK